MPNRSEYGYNEFFALFLQKCFYVQVVRRGGYEVALVKLLRALPLALQDSAVSVVRRA